MQAVIRDARVWTPGAEPVEGHDVVIRDGLIHAVVPTADRVAEPGETVTEAAGRTVIPGLIDAHVHLTTPSEQRRPVPNALFRTNALPAEKALHGYRNALKALAAGFTTLRVIGHRDAGEIELRDLIERRSFVGPRLKVAPWWISMTGGHGDLFYMKGMTRDPLDTADGPDQVRRLVRVQAARGADFIKVMASGGVMSAGDKPEWPNYTVEEIAAIVDEAHSFGIPVTAHAHSREGIRRSLDAGVDSIEHGTGLDAELRSQMVEQGTFLVPTLLIGAEVADAGPDSVVPEDHRAGMADVARAQLEQVAEAVADGVRIACGTDTSGNVCPFGRHARELELYVAAGMSHVQALETATSHAAELLGLAGRTGCVTPGAPADLLVVDGDPVSDVTILRDRARLRNVIVGGVDVTAFLDAVTDAMPA